MHALAKAKKAASLKPSVKPAPSTVSAGKVLAELEQHVLMDGLKLVFDAEKSHGSVFVDAATGRELIDFYSFYASQPVGFNHPHFDRPEVHKDLLIAAKVKVANSDVYTVQYATFVKTFARVMGLPPLDRYFFIEGGALAVENALKAAMDWKVRRNLAAGRGERGTEIIHFERAFHGRSGYTLSLTNTDPRKTAYFAKFPWPRVPAPTLHFALPPDQRIQAVSAKEQEVEQQIRSILAQKGADIAAIILEPIQGEGGDNHFRGEFLRTLRNICDDQEVLLIFDEVQCGMGITGKNWCCEHFGVPPDLLAFGKKAQVCGVMAGPRLDEVTDNCFRLPSRISSTWGGNFTDYVRSTHYLRIIEEEKLVENARKQGDYLLAGLQSLAAAHPMISAVRGRGLMLAFDLPTAQWRDGFWKGAYELGLLVIRSGERSVRLRPMLDVTSADIDRALRFIKLCCKKLEAAYSNPKRQ
ncbi:MAG TPA: L-lysine 6-transaminase [Candidatus Acidoferrum sp.]|jgi:L-lysine 6-transaminase|nr:L-lysine 6-transaminase [Candidatus Acidoferrum sp.]